MSAATSSTGVTIGGSPPSASNLLLDFESLGLFDPLNLVLESVSPASLFAKQTIDAGFCFSIEFLGKLW